MEEHLVYNGALKDWCETHLCETVFYKEDLAHLLFSHFPLTHVNFLMWKENFLIALNQFM